VQLLQSDRIGVPIVVGWRNPAILLPAVLAQSCDRQAIDAVMLHELTHVGRGDYAWNLLLRIVRAIYWPHPGAWLACHMVRLVREEVCDAVCVYWMADARAYCGILVDVAAGLMERPEAALGMAMTHSSKLSRRLARVGQSAGSARGVLGRAARVTIAACVVGCVSLLGTLQFVGRASAEGRTRQQLAASLTSRAASARTADEPGPQHDALALANEPEADRAELKTQNDALKSPEKSQPQRVTTIKVKRGKLENVTIQPATLEAAGQVSIYARSSGIVLKTLVDIGDPVKARDVLAELDLPDAGIDVAEKEAVREQAEAVQEQAKAVLDAARAGVDAQEAHVAAARAESEKAASTEKFRKIQYERMKTLFEQKSVEERLLDEKEEQYKAAVAASKSEAAKIQTTAADVAKAKIDLRVAEAALKLAKVRTAVAVANLARSKAQNGEDFRLIRSPIDGVVVEKNTNAGVLVNRGENQPLFCIAAAGLITAVVQLPERDAVTAQRGDPATLEFDALNKQPAIAGKISRLAYGLDRTTRTLRAEITLSNADGRLKPGMYGKARIVTGEMADVLSIPKSALYNVKGETAACYRAVDGRAAATTVKLGYDNGEQVEIVEGLAEGDVVVADSSTVKQNGDPASEDAP